MICRKSSGVFSQYDYFTWHSRQSRTFLIISHNDVKEIQLRDQMRQPESGTTRLIQESSTTVTRALDVLTVLSTRPTGIPVSELATLVGTQRAPLYRILRSLENGQFIRRDANRLYHLSFGLLRLAASITEPLNNVAKTVLEALANQTDCSAMLLLMSKNSEIVTAVCATPSVPGMHVTTPPGFVHKGDRIASRVAIESARPPQDDDPVDVILARQLGYAISGEKASGHRFGISVPVDLSSIGEEGCILLFTLDEIEVNEITAPLLQAASQISATLGTA